MLYKQKGKASSINNFDKFFNAIITVKVKEIFVISAITLLAIITYKISEVLVARKYNNQYQENLSIKSGEIKESIQSDITYINHEMQEVAKQIADSNLSDDAIYKILARHRTYRQVNVATSWNMFSWVNKDFYLTIDGNEGFIENPVNMSKRDYIPKTKIKPWELQIGAPVYGAVSKQWLIPMGVGIVDNNNVYKGSLIFGYDITSLVYKIHTITSESSLYFAVFDSNLNQIASSINYDTLADSKKINKIFAEGKFRTEPNYRKDLIQTFKLEKYPFFVVVGSDTSEMMAIIKNENHLKRVFFIATAILIILILLVVKYLFFNPTVRLQKVLGDIAGNKKNIYKLPRAMGKDFRHFNKSIIKIRKMLNSKNAKYHKIQKELNKTQHILSVTEESSVTKSKLVKDISYKNSLMLAEIGHKISNIINMKQKGNILMSPAHELEILSKLHKEIALLIYHTGIDFCKEEIDIRYVINDSMKIYKRELLDRAIELTISSELDDDNCKVYIDPVRFKQAFVAIIEQTKLFIPRNGFIKIHSYLNENKEVVTQIKDSGFLLSDMERIRYSNKAIDDPTNLEIMVAKKIMERQNIKFIETEKQDDGNICLMIFVKPKSLTDKDEDNKKNTNNVVELKVI